MPNKRRCLVTRRRVTPRGRADVLRSKEGNRMKAGRLLPFLFITIGVILMWFGMRGVIRAKASVDWPTAQGKVVTSSVESVRSTGSKAKNATYHARILYEFPVDGRTVNGNRVAYGDYGSSSPSHARQMVERYPPGKRITVYYMPGNPQECLLEPGPKAQSWALPLGGLIFVAIGCLIVSSLRRSRQKAEPDGAQDTPCEVLKDFGVLDEVGAGASLMRTEAKMSLRGGMRILQVTMTYGTGADKRWQTFIWRINGNQMKDVVGDLERVIRMVEGGQGKKVHGRWIERIMAHFQHIRFLRDLGPVSFHDGQDKVGGLTGEAFGGLYFLYEVVQGGRTEIQPFPLSSLRAIVKVLRPA